MSLAAGKEVVERAPTEPEQRLIALQKSPQRFKQAIAVADEDEAEEQVLQFVALSV